MSVVRALLGATTIRRIGTEACPRFQALEMEDRMNWVRAIAGIVVLWSGSAAAATLSWNANNEGDLVGYRLYQCNALPCTPGSGNQSLLVTLGKVTSYNVGTPSTTKYYYLTAIDTTNKESASSNVATFTPATSQSSGGSQTTGTNALQNVKLTVIGVPAIGPWGVEGSTTDMRDVMAVINLDGKKYWTDSIPPYSFPATSAPWTTTSTYGNGLHTVEFVFYLEGTSAEIGRANVTVQEGTSTTTTSSGGTTQTVTPTVSLKVVGNPATGPWGVEGSTTDMRDVMAVQFLDGKKYWTDSIAPYSFPATSAPWTTTSKFGAGPHTVEFVWYLEGTTTEVGRAKVNVVEGP
jgi:hypothetical protein